VKPADQFIADAMSDAQVLRRRGHTHDAELIEGIIREAQQVFEPFLTWLKEPDAMLRSGEPPNFFRRNRVRWSSINMAKKEGRVWYYLQAVVPQRTHVSGVVADAKRAARQPAS
jgi:hypothetical protein